MLDLSFELDEIPWISLLAMATIKDYSSSKRRGELYFL